MIQPRTVIPRAVACRASASPLAARWRALGLLLVALAALAVIAGCGMRGRGHFKPPGLPGPPPGL